MNIIKSRENTIMNKWRAFEYLKFFLKRLLTLNGLFILNFYSLCRSILVLHATAAERYSDEKPTKNYKRKSFKVWK